MYYPDLSPYAYRPKVDLPGAGVKRVDLVLNVGWLDVVEPHVTGPVSAEFRRCLARLLKSPIHLTRGYHGCVFCLVDVQARLEVLNGVTVSRELHKLGALGNGEIAVEGCRGVWYLAPRLILHYVEMHDYRPPGEFVDALCRTCGTA